MSLRALTQHQALRGIAIGRCVKDVPLKEIAHAHIHPGRYFGWVCVASHYHLNATTVCHELGHIVSGERTHTDVWRRAVRELGGRVELRYLKK